MAIFAFPSQLTQPYLRSHSPASACVMHILVATLGLCCAGPLRAGSELLRRALGACMEDDAIRSAALHVHSVNEEAVAFYQRHGFQVSESNVSSAVFTRAARSKCHNGGFQQRRHNHRGLTHGIGRLVSLSGRYMSDWYILCAEITC